MSEISVLEHEPTGQAFISIDDEGENSIIIIPGANGALTPELIGKKEESLKKNIENSDIIVMQLEIPLETVTYVKETGSFFPKNYNCRPRPCRYRYS